MATGLLVRPLGRTLRLEVGGFERPVLGAWPRADRADVDEEAAGAGPRSFYYRPLPAQATVRLPVVADEGSVRVTLRAAARIRSGLTVFLGPERLGEVIVGPGRFALFPGPWSWLALEGRVPAGAPIAIGLATRPLPLVRRSAEDLAAAEIILDSLEVEASGGLRLAPGAALLAAAVPLAVAVFLAALGFGPGRVVGGAALAALLIVSSTRAAPIPTLMALPRLLPFAFAAAVVTALGLRRAVSGGGAALALLVFVGVLFHGSLVFFPNHNPPDLDIHVRRTLDLAAVPFDYQALLRYGSQLPTASQDRGAATAALGERTLIPYSPLPYLAYFALHRAGLDLAWAITVLNATLAMMLAPLMWVAATRLWNRNAAWLAALLYTLDLAVWHHLGRSHAPAVFGAALGSAALLHLAARAEDLDRPRSVALAAALLALGALGYSSSVVLFGLFGLVLVALSLVDARGLSAPARRGLVLALVAGGLVAGAAYYFHYVPGLVRGAATVEAEADLFPGRRFFIFHNESRQSLRLWALGFGFPLLGGLIAAPFALRAVRPSARPVLVAWLLAWALLMFLKEPFLFPKLLRWAKEDQFVSPLLALLLAGGAWSLPRPWMRWGASAALLAVALFLELRDFGHHAVSLRL